MRYVLLPLAISWVVLAYGCATHSAQTTLAGQAVAMMRPKVGEGPSLRIHIPNVRRVGPRTWPEAFASIFGSVPIASAALGAPIAVPLTALGGKTAVDLLRSGPDAVSDIVFDIDGLAESIEIDGVSVEEQFTRIQRVTIRMYDKWSALGGVEAQQQ